MITILLFLVVVSVLLSIKHYKKGMFIFPESVKVSRLQGFLAWIGWTNLFVSIPFLWDGDFKKGVYPLVIGLVPLISGIVLVIMSNIDKTVAKDGDIKILLNEGTSMIEPSNIEYGFLNNFKKRMAQIGPKYYFKEIFAREKATKGLVEALITGDPVETAASIKTLPWVVDGAITAKAQLCFLIEYLFTRYPQNDVVKDLNKIVENLKTVAKEVELDFKDTPYKIAKIMAQSSCAVNTNEENVTFIIDTNCYVCDEDEYVTSAFHGRVFDLETNTRSVLKLVFALVKYYSSKDKAHLIITNKKVILEAYGEQKAYPLDILDNYRFVLNCVSFDNKFYVELESKDLFLITVKSIIENQK